MQIYLKEITVRTYGGSKEYDGTPLSSNNYVIEGNLLSGHTLKSLVCTGKQTSVGRSSNNFEIAICDESGADVTDYYKVNRICATLTVTPKTITVTANSAIKSYDGKSLTEAGYTVEGDIEGYTLEVAIVGSQTNIGYSDNVIQNVIIKNSLGQNVTLNFTIICINGKLMVTPPTN
jgi:hypothetical protein